MDGNLELILEKTMDFSLSLEAKYHQYSFTAFQELTSIRLCKSRLSGKSCQVLVMKCT